MKAIRAKLKETIIGVLLGGLLLVVPFYFETKAMTEDNHILNLQQEINIDNLNNETVEMKLNQAVAQTKIEHNKEILLRIEKKIDELKQEVKDI